MQNSTFTYPTGYYDPGRLQLVGRQDTVLSCHLPISTFVALCDHNPPTLQTNGQTDVMLVAYERFVALKTELSMTSSYDLLFIVCLKTGGKLPVYTELSRHNYAVLQKKWHTTVPKYPLFWREKCRNADSSASWVVRNLRRTDPSCSSIVPVFK